MESQIEDRHGTELEKGFEDDHMYKVVETRTSFPINQMKLGPTKVKSEFLSDDERHQGYLMKQKPDFLKQYQTRYFVLH